MENENNRITIDIFDEISSETLKEVVHATENLPDGFDVDIRIASYGGEFLPALAIIETLKRFHTHANVIGFVCSASAIIAIACEECTMSENALMLLHSAWSEDVENDDPGIQKCNEVQLSIIKKRCPDFDPKNLQKDTWLNADQCLEMHLVNSIYIDDNNINYLAVCQKYAAKLSTIKCMEAITMPEEKVSEVVEEVKEEVKEEQNEVHPDENHQLIEVIEKLTEEVNALKARVVALEEVKEVKKEEIKEEEVQAECDPEQERINNIYRSIVAPQARVAIGSPKAEGAKRVHKVDYKNFKSFIND